MKKRHAMSIVTALAVAAAAVGAPATARAEPGAACRYRVFDVGTLGGSLSLFYNFDQVNFTPAPLNERGQLSVTSLTAGGFASAAIWERDALHALPNFPDANVGGGGSNANGVNAWGHVVGAADDGVINPLNGAPYDHAALWDAGGIHRLPELGGVASWANFITDEGVVVGYVNDTIADPYTYAGTQTHAVVWRNGVARDLGTLGGSDSAAFASSRCPWEGGAPLAVIGTSATGTTPIAPFGIPQTDAFVWSAGVLQDLGGLGGGFSTPSAITCRGDVAVIAFDASNAAFQSFVWSHGRRVMLQPLGGHFVEAADMDDEREVAGAVSDASDQSALAATWGPDGQGRTLGVIGSDTGSIALGINERGVIVGGSGSVSFTAAANYAHAFVAMPGGSIEDLNTLVPAGSPLTLNVAYAVNDAGVIAGLGTSSTGEEHAFVLVPDSCDGERAQGAGASVAEGSRVRSAVGRSVQRGKRDGLRR